MNTIKNIVSCGLLLVSVLIVNAQTDESLTIAQERQFLLNALRLIENYDNYSDMTDYEEASNFMDLFASDSMMIYNDLLGLSEKSTISVRDYADLLVRRGRSPKIDVKNITHGNIYNDNDNWLVDIHFDKSLLYTDTDGILLSSKEYYEGADHKITVSVAMDKISERVYIKSIEGSIDSHIERLPEHYAAVQYTSPRDKEVLCNDKKLVFNSFDQSLVPASPNFTYYDDDANMTVIKKPGTAELYSFKFRPTHWRVKPRLEIGLGHFYNFGEGGTGGKGLNFGVDFGYIFPSSGKIKFGVFSGLACSISSMSFSMGGLDYSYQTSGGVADVDGDDYVRHYKFSSIEQSVKATDLMIPIYLDIDYRIARSYSVYVQVGLKNFMNLSSKTDDVKAIADIWGVYPQYGNLVLDGPWGDDNSIIYNNFGKNRELNSVSDIKQSLLSYTIDGFIGVGVRIKLIKSILLDMGANYQYGFMNLNEGVDNSAKELVSYTVTEGEKLRSLFNSLEKVHRQTFNVNLGVMYKF